MHNQSLQDLYLYNNDIDDEILEHFSKMLANKPNLQVLGLEYNRIRSKGAVKLFNTVQNLPRFERFFISHNLLDHEISQAASALVAHSTSLKEIRINDNSMMGDDCGYDISQALLQSRSIRVCHIAGTKISGKSATKLAEVLR